LSEDGAFSLDGFLVNYPAFPTGIYGLAKRNDYDMIKTSGRWSAIRIALAPVALWAFSAKAV